MDQDEVHHEIIYVKNKRVISFDIAKQQVGPKCPVVIPTKSQGIFCPGSSAFR